MSKCTNCPHAGKYVFCNLGEEARKFLDTQSISMEYPRGNTIFREGDSGDAVFVLCSGKVKMTATSSEGRSAILRIAGPGDVLGVSAVLTSGSYEVTAEALEPCRIRVLHARTLTHFMKEFSDATVGVTRALTQDYRAAFQEVRRIALPETPAGRVARLLLDWVDDNKSKTPSTITMALTHEELASMTATTRETVTRTLSRFRKENVISTKGVSLTVLQPAVLRLLSAC